MRIVLATPLYPPEIAEPAPYIKELAKRLAKSHEVTIVAYARLPEDVPGARIIAVDKYLPLFLRLPRYFFSLLQAARSADVVYAVNGASVELPAALVSLFSSSPLIIRIGDRAAHERAQNNIVAGLIERFAFSRARDVIEDAPKVRPEIIPFEPYPAEQFAAYEQSWDAHLRTLEKLFTHATA